MRQRAPEEDLTARLRSALASGYYYPYHPNILIGGEIPIYYGDRDPVTHRFPHIVPDILIALNVDSYAIDNRIGYDPIQNGKPPDVVVEIASPSTYRNDAGRKRDIYQMLRVPEYWRFDPSGGRMFGQAIIGEQLVDDRYERLPLLRYDGVIVGSTSPLLNLNFRYWSNRIFTVHDPETGQEYEHPEQRRERTSAGRNPPPAGKLTAAVVQGKRWPLPQRRGQHPHGSLAHGIGTKRSHCARVAVDAIRRQLPGS